MWIHSHLELTPALRDLVLSYGLQRYTCGTNAYMLTKHSYIKGIFFKKNSASNKTVNQKTDTEDDITSLLKDQCTTIGWCACV